MEKTSGRRMSRGKSESAAAPPAAADDTPGFAGAPLPDDAPDAASPVPVVAIVSALLLIGGAVLAVVLVLGGVAYVQADDPLGLYTTTKQPRPPAPLSDTASRTRENTLVSESERAAEREAAASAAASAAACEAARAAPWHAVGTVVLAAGHPPFHGIEVVCPSGLRTRASFRGKRATTRAELPSNEDCDVHFQGGAPASTTLSAGQTRTCSFGPVRCEVTARQERPPIPACE